MEGESTSDVKIEAYDIYGDDFESEALNFKQERLAAAKEDEEDAEDLTIKTHSKSPAKSAKARSQMDFKPQFITHLPDAEKAAMETFTLLEENSFQNKSIGTARQQEDSFMCDCRYIPGGNMRKMACGEDADCINRLTQVECPPDECKCGRHCQNRRIQRKEYAPIRIVQTEKKGFGVMAAADLETDQLVIEYMGEIIAHNNFMRRLRGYAEEGIRHFYFMALQKDEYIDATKKGGRGRFLNHSCNPNCYVAKWVVGKKMRMAIFAKRDISYGEELTFNYNVDRYGHEAQECYCGEPNCIGYIGGKTQTDLGNMDDLYLDALGITAEVEALGLKGNKKRKGLKLDEDFWPEMKPIILDDAPKVSSAIRQASSNKRILTKLLERILKTEAAEVQSQLMRLRGFSLMAMLLDEHADDIDNVIIPVLQVLTKWPLLTRNKISSTNVESLVTNIKENAMSDTAQELATNLLSTWSGLDLAYRIPKAMLEGATNADGSVNEQILRSLFSGAGSTTQERLTEIVAMANDFVKPQAAYINLKKGTALEQAKAQGLPDNWGVGTDPVGRHYYYHLRTRESRWTIPTKEEADKIEKALMKPDTSIDAILDRVKAQADKAAAQAAEAAQAQAALAVIDSSGKQEKEERRRRKAEKREAQKAERRKQKDAANKDKRLPRLLGPVVVKTMAKYTGGCLEKDQFKRRAKEITNILVDKEKRRSTYSETDYQSLTSSHEDRIKAFTKDYILKLIAKKGLKPGRRPERPSSPTKSSSLSTSSLSASTPSTPITNGSHTALGMEIEETSTAKDVLQEMEDESMEMEASEDEQAESDVDSTNGETPTTVTPITPSTSGGVKSNGFQLLAPPPPPEEDKLNGYNTQIYSDAASAMQIGQA